MGKSADERIDEIVWPALSVDTASDDDLLRWAKKARAEARKRALDLVRQARD